MWVDKYVGKIIFMPFPQIPFINKVKWQPGKIFATFLTDKGFIS